MDALCKYAYINPEGCLPVKVLVIGRLDNNTYVLSDGEGPHAETIVIDPAGDVDAILQVIGDNHLTSILVTHHHNDHVFGLAELVERTHAPVLASQIDAVKIEQAQPGIFSDAEKVPGTHVDVKLQHGDTITVGSLTLTALLTPGHTKGGMCFYLPGNDGSGMLFSGDTLFRGTTGRIDFEGGSEEDMRASLRNVLSELPDDTVVYPGHGDYTTIGFERKTLLERY